jgi:hypothetical protein
MSGWLFQPWGQYTRATRMYVLLVLLLYSFAQTTVDVLFSDSFTTRFDNDLTTPLAQTAMGFALANVVCTLYIFACGGGMTALLKFAKPHVIQLLFLSLMTCVTLGFRGLATHLQSTTSTLFVIIFVPVFVPLGAVCFERRHQDGHMVQYGMWPCCLGSRASNPHCGVCPGILAIVVACALAISRLGTLATPIGMTCALPPPRCRPLPPTAATDRCVATMVARESLTAVRHSLAVFVRGCRVLPGSIIAMMSELLALVTAAVLLGRDKPDLAAPIALAWWVTLIATPVLLLLSLPFTEGERITRFAEQRARAHATNAPPPPRPSHASDAPRHLPPSRCRRSPAHPSPALSPPLAAPASAWTCAWRRASSSLATRHASPRRARADTDVSVPAARCVGWFLQADATRR